MFYAYEYNKFLFIAWTNVTLHKYPIFKRKNIACFSHLFLVVQVSRLYRIFIFLKIFGQKYIRLKFDNLILLVECVST